MCVCMWNVHMCICVYRRVSPLMQADVDARSWWWDVLFYRAFPVILLWQGLSLKLVTSVKMSDQRILEAIYLCAPALAV